MAKSPDKPTGSGLGTDPLPWLPSPGSQDPMESATAAAEGFTEGATSAEETIGGGSHGAGDQTTEAALEIARDAAEKGHEAAELLAAGTLTFRNALEGAIVARPLGFVAVAAVAGFVAALLFRR